MVHSQLYSAFVRNAIDLDLRKIVDRTKSRLQIIVSFRKSIEDRKRERLEEQSAHAASNFTLFFDEDFEILVDDCDSEQDTSA